MQGGEGPDGAAGQGDVGVADDPEHAPRMLPRLERALPTELTRLDRPVSAFLRENLHYSFSGFNWTPAFLDLLLQVGADRILFSTDHPTCP